MKCPKCKKENCKWIECGKFCPDCKTVWLEDEKGIPRHPITGKKQNGINNNLPCKDDFSSADELRQEQQKQLQEDLYIFNSVEYH